jgi:hypothetical protein
VKEVGNSCAGQQRSIISLCKYYQEEEEEIQIFVKATVF